MTEKSFNGAVFKEMESFREPQSSFLDAPPVLFYNFYGFRKNLFRCILLQWNDAVVSNPVLFMLPKKAVNGLFTMVSVGTSQVLARRCIIRACSAGKEVSAGVLCRKSSEILKNLITSSEHEMTASYSCPATGGSMSASITLPSFWYSSSTVGR
ncbi:hypothetical protein CEXT_722321 [Caerostris extrusa]|uniref:Uncharacterized protein n=1 Tax=Caerostris extrusa TaxID=172846 RepID=A0AAV4VGW2_CAEEX|nr:hypothetical protein CEXT_722321 [Caerostris extrusa]